MFHNKKVSLKTLEMYDNESTASSETPNTSHFSDIASPVVRPSPARPHRKCRKNYVLDEDTELQLEPTPTRLIAARGQKLAVERFEKIKSKIALAFIISSVSIIIIFIHRKFGAES